MPWLAAKEHRDILNALASRDSAAAILARRKHIDSGWTVMKSETVG